MAIAAPFPAARAARPHGADRAAARTATRPGQRPGSRGATRPVPRTASRRDGLVLTRRGKVVLGVLSTLFLLVVVLLSGRFTAEAGTSAAEQGAATGVVVVQAGESLWQIAKAVAPEVDPRQTITTIRELNGLGDEPVVPGQSIIVPVGTPAA